MKLSEYLSSKKIKPSAFAAEIGVSPSTVTRILREERFPGFETIIRIKAATRGKVSEKDWVEAKQVVA